MERFEEPGPLHEIRSVAALLLSSQYVGLENVSRWFLYDCNGTAVQGRNTARAASADYILNGVLPVGH